MIAGFSSSGFDELSALNHEVAAAWREIEDYGGENWALSLAKAARCSPATVYNCRKEWLKRFGIDLALPHAFYRDMLFFAPNSLTEPRVRSAWLRAVRGETERRWSGAHDARRWSSIVCGPRSSGRRFAPTRAAWRSRSRLRAPCRRRPLALASVETPRRRSATATATRAAINSTTISLGSMLRSARCSASRAGKNDGDRSRAAADRKACVNGQLHKGSGGPAPGRRGPISL